jgi:hypothetical protein
LTATSINARASPLVKPSSPRAKNKEEEKERATPPPDDDAAARRRRRRRRLFFVALFPHTTTSTSLLRHRLATAAPSPTRRSCSLAPSLSPGKKKHNAMAADDENAADDLRHIYTAVLENKSAEEISDLLDEVARGSDERRRAAVNFVGKNEHREREMPLQAAGRLARGIDTMALLVDAGASLEAFQGGGDRVTALALCICFKTREDLRALLRQGRQDVNQRCPEDWWREGGPVDAGRFITAAHECVYAQKLDCLEVLVREGGVDVNSRDWPNRTPLHVLAECAYGYTDPSAALDKLFSLGADLEARDDYGNPVIFYCAGFGDGAPDRSGDRVLRALLKAVAASLARKRDQAGRGGGGGATSGGGGSGGGAAAPSWSSRSTGGSEVVVVSSGWTGEEGGEAASSKRRRGE